MFGVNVYMCRGIATSHALDLRCLPEAREVIAHGVVKKPFEITHTGHGKILEDFSIPDRLWYEMGCAIPKHISLIACILTKGDEEKSIQGSQLKFGARKSCQIGSANYCSESKR